MYQLLSLINGVILAFMISINGKLSEKYNAFTAAAIIHVVGSLFALLICALKKDKKHLWSHKPKWIYLGGAIGVFTTVFNNLAFGYISITSVIALGLLGQTITSLVIDIFGLFGMEKRPLKKYSLIGLGFSVFGIFMMVDTSIMTAVFAIVISFASGISVVLSRTVNARLAEKTDALYSSLANHLVGLPITILIALATSKMDLFAVAESGSFQPWIYLGGIIGVIVVVLFNITVPKVPALKLTLLVFVGQVFAGIILDAMVGKNYSDKSFFGGIVIALGIAINMIIEWINAAKEQKNLYLK